MLDGQLLGYVGQLSAEGRKQSDLRGAATVAELKLAALFQRAEADSAVRAAARLPRRIAD